MRIQNRNMAGLRLALRYARDRVDPANGRVVVGDATGVFDIPERDANALLQTKGWKRAPKKKPEPEPEPEGEAEEEEDGPSVDDLRTKDDAIKLRDAWVEKGYDIPAFEKDAMRLSDMKAELNKAIYGEG